MEKKAKWITAYPWIAVESVADSSFRADASVL